MSLLLSENLPLRTSAMLGVSFSEAKVLPVRYGDLSQSPCALIKLSETEYFVSDHASKVLKVFVDTQETQGFAARIKKDASGKPFTIVELTAPAPQGAIITATLTGKVSAVTGALIENPADVIADILSMAGKHWDFTSVRLECAKQGVRVAGSLTDIQSVKAHIDSVARSVGIVWTQGFFALYPAAPGGHIDTLDKTNSQIYDAHAELQNTAGSIRVNFAQDDFSKLSGQFVLLRAKGSQYDTETIVEAPWLRDYGSAVWLGERLLRRKAGNVLIVALDTDQKNLKHGEWRYVDFPFFQGNMMVLASEALPGSHRSRVFGEILFPGSISVEIVSRSAVARPPQGGGIEIATTNGLSTFTIYDPNNKRLSGALVGLDGGTPKKTDINGEVSFEAAPGDHLLAVQADGFQPFQLTVTVAKK